MRIDARDALLLVVDMQEKLVPAMQNGAACTERLLMLTKGCRILDVPLMLTQQYTKGLGPSLAAVYEAAGTEEFYEKNSFSCCQDAAILAALKEAGRRHILVCGIEAHVCVLQTCIDLLQEGFSPVLVTDAVDSRRETDRAAGLLRARQEGVVVTSAEAILFELTGSASHPRFKEISKLVK